MGTTGGVNTMSFAENAAAIASRVSALQLSIARNMRVSEKLYRKGAFFAENVACRRRCTGR